MLPRPLAAQQNLPFGISLPPSLNFATSPSPVGSGARAQGQGLAFIAVADDATAASHNPGGLLQLLQPEASIVGALLVRQEQQDVTRPETIVENQTFDSFNLNYLSVVYPFEFLRHNWVVSLNYQHLFDLKGEADVASLYTTVTGVQRVQSQQEGGLFTISPAVAVEITPNLAVGVAFNVWPDFLNNGWKQDVVVEGEGRVVKGNSIVPFVSAGHIHEDFAFKGFNVTAGFLWEISSRISLGGVFRSPFTAKVTRTHSSSLTVALRDGSAPVTSTLRFRESLDMNMPMVYGLGVSVRATDGLRLSLDVSRIHWSDFRLEASKQERVLLVENGAPSGKGQAVLRGQSNDTTAVRLGAQYLWLKPQVAARAGMFYDPEPGAHGTDNFFGVSLGAGLTIARTVFDLAYTFRTGTIQSTATDTSVFHHELLASLIYHF
jgi:long-subunit fatty acid transport protein